MIINQDIKMKFEFKNVQRKGKKRSIEVIEQDKEEIIRKIKEKENYKYLRLTKANLVKYNNETS